MNGSNTVFVPADICQDTVEGLYAEHGLQRPWIYWLTLAGVIGALASLPLIEVDVSVQAAGLVRPATELANLRPAVSGLIDKVLVRENDRVNAGQPLLVLRSPELAEQLARNRDAQAEHADLIADFNTLTTGLDLSPAVQADDREQKGESTGPLPSPLSHRGGPVVNTLFRRGPSRQKCPQYRAQYDSCQLAMTRVRDELAAPWYLPASDSEMERHFEHAF